MPPASQPPDPFRQMDMEAATVAERRTSFVSAGMPPASVDLMMGAWLAVAGWLNAQPEAAPLYCPLGPACANSHGQQLHLWQPGCSRVADVGGTEDGHAA